MDINFMSIHNLSCVILVVIKQYDSTGFGAIVASAAKNAASKNHPKDILRNKNRNSTSPPYIECCI